MADQKDGRCLFKDKCKSDHCFFSNKTGSKKCPIATNLEANEEYDKLRDNEFKQAYECGKAKTIEAVLKTVDRMIDEIKNVRKTVPKLNKDRLDCALGNLNELRKEMSKI